MSSLTNQSLEAIFKRTASEDGLLTFPQFFKLLSEVHSKEQPGKPPITEEFATYVFTDKNVLAFPNTEHSVSQSVFVAKFNRYWVPRRDLLRHYLDPDGEEESEEGSETETDEEPHHLFGEVDRHGAGNNAQVKGPTSSASSSNAPAMSQKSLGPAEPTKFSGPTVSSSTPATISPAQKPSSEDEVSLLRTELERYKRAGKQCLQELLDARRHAKEVFEELQDAKELNGKLEKAGKAQYWIAEVQQQVHYLEAMHEQQQVLEGSNENLRSEHEAELLACRKLREKAAIQDAKHQKLQTQHEAETLACHQFREEMHGGPFATSRRRASASADHAAILRKFLGEEEPPMSGLGMPRELQRRSAQSALSSWQQELLEETFVAREERHLCAENAEEAEEARQRVVAVGQELEASRARGDAEAAAFRLVREELWQERMEQERLRTEARRAVQALESAAATSDERVLMSEDGDRAKRELREMRRQNELESAACRRAREELARIDVEDFHREKRKVGQQRLPQGATSSSENPWGLLSAQGRIAQLPLTQNGDPGMPAAHSDATLEERGRALEERGRAKIEAARSRLDELHRSADLGRPISRALENGGDGYPSRMGGPMNAIAPMSSYRR